MFNFFKKTAKEDLTLQGLPVTTDIHSHVLPGIDDGSPDIATSIRLLKGLQQLGIKKMVATPHIIADLYRNTPETIKSALERLKPVMEQEQVDIELTAAAEYMMDDYLLKLLKNDEPLLTIHKNIVLTEQSYATPTVNLNEIAFIMVSLGYRPIMAHPERYGYYHNNYDEYTHLKDMGFLLQVNLLSLTGYYGKSVAKAAKYILENDLADFVGTDLHHDRHLEMLGSPSNLQLFHRYTSTKTYNDFTAL